MGITELIVEKGLKEGYSAAGDVLLVESLNIYRAYGEALAALRALFYFEFYFRGEVQRVPRVELPFQYRHR